MNNVLLLGGFGFIGSNLIEELIKRNRYKIFVFEFKGVLNRFGDNITVFYGDYNNTEDLEYIFKNNNIDIVFHLISTTVPVTSNENIVYDIESNLVSSVRLLNVMIKYNVKKFVFLSSGGTVYGKVSVDKVDERHSTNPISAHGITKLCIEKYIYLYKHLYDLDYIILRVANPYGPYHNSEKQGIINVAIKRAIENRKLIIWGDGSVVRDYIYVKDLAYIICEIIGLNIWNNTINVASGIGYSINKILQFVKELPVDLEVIYSPSHKYDVPYIVLNNDKLKSLINYEPTEIRNGIRDTFEWIKENR